jgi:MSHA biogenesis protein MshP
MILSRCHNPNKETQATQQGSALMLALFIIIVLTLLGSALVKILSTSSESIAQEVIGTRALMAANSGMQAELQILFPLNSVASCPVEPAVRITDYNGLSAIEGLTHCWAQTRCSEYFTDPETNTKYYRLTSTGECGSGQVISDSKAVVRSTRTIQVEARSL